MRAVTKPAAEPGFALQQVPVPQPGPNEVLIRVEQAAICGTDVHIYNWDAWAASRVRPGTIIGHEFMGRVAAVGAQVSSLRPGDRVSGEGHITCGTCYFCRTGERHICERTRIIGIDVNGCFADYLCLPSENVWPLHASIPDHLGTLHDPLGNAVHTVTKDRIAGMIVLVVGVGPIGLMTVNVAKALGASKVIALDTNDKRLAIARQLGADAALNVTREGFAHRVLGHTPGGHGADVLLEVSGSESGIRTGLRLLRRGGWAAFLGLPAGDVALNLAEDVVFKGATLYGITGRKMFETWYQMERLLTEGKLHLGPIVTHEVPLEAIGEGMEWMRRGEAVKVIVKIADSPS